MPEQVDILWTYRATAELRRVAITNDGQLIFAGGIDGMLYCFALQSELLWKIDLHSAVTCLTLARGSERILIGCENGKVYQWTYQGHLLREFQTTGSIWNIGVTPTAHLMAISTSTGVLTLLDARCALLWTRTFSNSIYHLSITPDGRFIALGAEDHHIYLFDHLGHEQWRFATQSPVRAGAQISVNGEVVLAGSNDQHIYLVDRSEHLRWSYKTNGSLNVTALTPDGRFATAAGNGNTVFLFDINGKLLWRYAAKGNVYSLAISHDGRFVAAGTYENDNSIYLLDQAGNSLWTHRMRQRVCDVVMTPNGRLIAAVSQDNTILLAENRLAPSEMSSAWLAGNLITELHHTYATNPYEGIAACLDTFDQALLQRELELCDALVEEVATGGWVLQIEEHNALSSRKGALLLYQGLRHQQHGQTEQARRTYELGSEIYRRLHFQTGVGQAHAALHILEYGDGDREIGFVALLTDPPNVIGNSSLFLVRSIETGLIVEQHGAIQAAQNRGYLTPLLAGLSSSHESVQAAAAIALTWLIPGPEIDTLLEMLTHAKWVVRWQAIVMLKQRAEQYPRMFATQQYQVRQVVAQRLSREQDPMVLSMMATLLGKIGDSAQTNLLLPMLIDADADVRIAVIEALGQIGDRRALAALRQVAGGTDFAERSISKSATIAGQSIRQRYPGGYIRQVICSQQLSLQEKPVQPTTLFLMNNMAMHCMVTLTDVAVDSRVTCSVKFKNQAILKQEKHIKAPSGPPGAEELAQLDMIFSFDAPKRSWSPGNYMIEVALDGTVQKRQPFKVIREVFIKRAVICGRLTVSGSPIDERDIFATHTPVICCAVSLEEGPVGLDVLGKVFRIEKEPTSSVSPKRSIWRNIVGKHAAQPTQDLQLIDQCIVKTITEGKQWVAFAWKSAEWPPGEYIVKITIAKNTEASCKVLIAPSTL